MRYHFRFLFALLLMAASTGLLSCASMGADSLTVSSGTFMILRDALSAPVSELQARSDKGEARAQFSLSLIYLYGLRQIPMNIATATTLRQKALASRGYMPITQYIPGLNGKPGRTMIINMPRYDVGAYESKINQTCALALNAGDDTPEAFKACGNEAAYREFKPLWSAARS